MKQIIIFGFIAAITTTALPSCKNCATCHAEIMGVASPSQELCGDELKQAKKTAGMVCE